MTVRDYIRKFILMNWKNHKLQLSNPWELVLIVLIPPLFTLGAVALRFYIPVEPRSDKLYDPIDMDRHWMEMVEKLQKASDVAKEHNVKKNPFTPQLTIGWAPKRYNVFNSMMEKVTKQIDPMTKVGFDDCEKLRDAMIEDNLFAGLCFDGHAFKEDHNFEEGALENPANFHPVLNYTIFLPSELRMLGGNFMMGNWMTLYRDDPNTFVLVRLNQPEDGGFVGYVREGFIRLQKAVSEAFLILTSHKSLPTIQLRRFPVIAREQDPLMYYLDYGMSFLIVVGFLFPTQLFVWQVVNEKQSQVRQFLINMNIGNLIHFVSWYFKGLFYMLISSFLISVLLKIRWNHNHGVLTNTPWYIVLLVLTCYNIASVAFAIMVAAFFRNAHNAVRVMTIMWVMSYVPTFVLWNNPENKMQPLRYVSYIFPNVVLTLVLECLIEGESMFAIEWSDAGYHLNYKSGPITVAWSCWIFMLNALVYCAIGMYVDMWRGGERSSKKMKKPSTNASVHEDTYQERADSFTHQGQAIGVNSTKIYEVEPSHRRFKLKIKKLCKRFGANDRPALNLFSWNVYENEVTVLMGHNGCGKSTLLKILAGLVEPSRGTVMISSYNTQTERKAASMELGIAFGQEMLFASFTVMDYLRFICRVKGLHNSIEIEGQSNYFLNVLGLGRIKSKRIHKLTGGDLCLVSICCAFVGNSPIILIDDIHSDLDRETQALIWNLINEEKSKRTIILVCNSPALAEKIADRMAIMSNGELKCTGTKPFLKNMYGHGYRLTCVKGKHCKIEDLINLMNSYMPNMSIERDIGFKITFVLENKYEDQFPMLLDDLENNMQRLGVVSFRIRDTSMEEIFLRFGCEENEQMGGYQPHENTQVLLEEYYATLAEANERGRLTGWKLSLIHARAMFYKRWIVGLRHWLLVLFELMAIVFLSLCTFSSVVVYGKNYDLVPLTFNLSQLNTVDAFVELFSEEDEVKDMHAYYAELLYWYDAHVAILAKSRQKKYALLNPNDFSYHVNYRYIFGATFDQQKVVAWFNNIPLHTAPYALNVVHNAVARHLFDEEATIDVTLHPLPFQTSINTFPSSNIKFGALFACSTCFVFTFIWPAFAIFMISERGSIMKKQQFLAGARFCSYWMFTALYDIFFLLIYCLSLLILVAIYVDPSHDLMFYVFLSITIIMAGLWVILLAYLISAICRNPCYGLMWLCGINSVGLIVFVQLHRNELDKLKLSPSFLAMYSAAAVIFKIFVFYEYNLFCKDPHVNFTSIEVFKCKSTPNCCKSMDNLASAADIKEHLIVLALLILIISIILFFTEYNSVVGFGVCRARSKSAVPAERDQEGGMAHSQFSTSSTIPERHQTNNFSEEERSRCAAVGLDITTKFGRRQVLRNLDFSVAKSECVSITGANNSGKTTLLKLIVGEARPKKGQIWIMGTSMQRHRMRCYRMVGYCPQRDRPPAEFTPRDLLYIHALLQGHRHRIARELSESLLRMMGLTPCWNRSAHMCTTGQLRRLSFAHAVLSSPDLVCVDGVPAGLDPIGKQTILMMTSSMLSMGSSFMYTTLTSLDSERLCMRTPLLLDGQLYTIAALNGKTENYKGGYQLKVRFKRKVNPNVSMSRTTWNLINHFPMSPNKKFSAFMELKFPQATLKIDNEESMVFQLPLETTTFSEIFLTLRKDAFEMNIEDYFITRNVRIELQTLLINEY
ncbi:phospholipid-transporting ATPase ABCA3 [Drosophila ficusphila]|uniref:phospholipid-transporting ATPase ABCA3 n=1 Tax=Drosophila ficusphila TaxID=30025 RepID=UPI0007E6CC30|nr:phospholipid-transporting ATPase ABCA3 [Drosophila ficusphila]